MKQHLHSYRLLLIAAAICTLAAFWLLGARIGVEQTQRQVDVVISYEDTVRLADASGVPVQEWLTQLSDAGVRELLVTPDEQAKNILQWEVKQQRCQICCKKTHIHAYAAITDYHMVNITHNAAKQQTSKRGNNSLHKLRYIF